MELLLQRELSNAECTLGKLYIDSIEFCNTIEDPVRSQKIYGKTAIPSGRYRVRITHSPKFRRPLPLLYDVPNYEGVRIHSGNTAADTEGCIVLGLERGHNKVLKSRAALSKLLLRISQSKTPVWINIKNAPAV